MSHSISLRRHQARLARVATIVVITTAFSALQAAQRRSPPPPRPAAAPAQQPTKKAFEFSEKTSEAFKNLKPLQEKQDWDGMLALLEAIPVTKDSYDEAFILDMKAKIYATTNKLSKAIAPWERAVELSDQFGYFSEKQTLETVSLLAQLYGQEGSTSKVPAQQQQYFTKAIQYFKRFIEHTPKPTPETMMAYASILYYKAAADPNKVDQAVLKQARDIVERGLMSAVKPKEGFYQLLLTLQQQQNDLAGSAEILELLLKQSPAKKDYWQLLMASYLQLSEKAREKNPQLARQYLVRAIVTCERAQALGHLQTPKDNMNLVSLYLMANQFTKGTELLYTGMKSGKIESEPNNWRVLGRYYLEADQPKQAITVLLEAAKLFPKSSEIEVQIAQLYMQTENPKEALQHAKAAIAKNNFETTKPFSVHYLAAYTAYDLGDIEEAQKAIASAEKFPEAAKDPQFPKLKNVITEALAERDAKQKEKTDAKTKTTPKTAPKKAASL